MKGQSVVITSLCVKGDTQQAEREAVRRLALWFQESKPSDCREGEGFPVGTLLHFTIQKVHSLG